MASDLRGWETDPLFSGAEVVQDSADRMEAMYRLVLHESGLGQEDTSSSLKLHKRDLLTAIETTKWQLEDFEKEASLSVMRSKLRMRDDVVARYRQFIEAIREQMRYIEKSLDFSSLRDFEASHGNSNRQDEDNLALFLSGVDSIDQARLCGNDTKDSSIFGGFVDVNATPGTAEITNEIEENKTEDVGNLRTCGVANAAQDLSKADESIAKHSDWDVEACKFELLQRNKLGEFLQKLNILSRFFSSLPFIYGSRISRNFTRKLKEDGQAHSYVLNKLGHTKGHTGRNWSAPALIRFQVLCSQLTTRIVNSSDHHYACMKRRPIQSVVTVVFAALLLGVMVLQVSRK